MPYLSDKQAQQVRAAERILRSHGYEYTKHNHDLHFIITNVPVKVDYFPTTQYWRINSSNIYNKLGKYDGGYKGNGIKHLLSFLRLQQHLKEIITKEVKEEMMQQTPVKKSWFKTLFSK